MSVCPATLCTRNAQCLGAASSQEHTLSREMPQHSSIPKGQQLCLWHGRLAPLCLIWVQETLLAVLQALGWHYWHTDTPTIPK